MRYKTLLFRLVVMMAAVMCALGASAQEAYACYTSADSTLTFYYDNQRSSRTGTTYDVNLNQGSSFPAWIKNDVVSNVTKAVFDPSFANARPTSTGGWFCYMSKLKSITGLNFLNTSEVTYMAMMFYRCSNLTNLDLSSWNTAKVTEMSSMFNGCSSLKTIYVLEGWTTSAVTKSDFMFYDCTSLVGGMGTNYNAGHVDATYAHIDGGPSNPGYFTAGLEAYACFTPENTTLTFYYDKQRGNRTGTTYDLNTEENSAAWQAIAHYVNHVVFAPSFAAARPRSTYQWFLYMDNLQSITGMKEYLNTSEVTTMRNMFWGCSALTSLDVSGFNTSKVTDMSSLFMGCSSLTSLDVSGFNTVNVTDMEGLFADCSGLSSLDLSGWDTYKVSKMGLMFYRCSNLTTIFVGDNWTTHLISWNTSINMFYECTNLVGGQGTTYDAGHIDATYAHIDGGPSNPGYFTEISPEAYACYTESNTTLTFYYDNQRWNRPGTVYGLTLPDDLLWPGWYFDYDTQAAVTRVVFAPSFSNVRPQTTYAWFSGMSNLTTITGMEEYLNTSEVTNMNNMFTGCSSLTSLDVSGFNTSNVEYMANMFSYCSNLTNLDLSSFNTSNVSFMSGMFSYCGRLQSVNLSSFNTSNVVEMSDMFAECNKLASVDLSSFNTSNVTSMQNLFLFCYDLTSVDLSSFNTSNVTNMADMFGACSGLTTIYVGDEWSTSAVTPSTSMFYGCTSLVGGQGTTYDAGHIDATYAHIDGGPSNPGYFTEKQVGLRGDVNGDHEVTISDAIMLINAILNDDMSGVNMENADVNGDHEVTISDAIMLINYVLNETWP
ncbi:MAG: BspA family leucine-rich repeat surface protein [Muribaculaceae bacterium]|nr:BspA family leucine-rich repeat surface protein [Muribaculaceae bacterium]